MVKSSGCARRQPWPLALHLSKSGLQCQSHDDKVEDATCNNEATCVNVCRRGLLLMLTFTCMTTQLHCHQQCTERCCSAETYWIRSTKSLWLVKDVASGASSCHSDVFSSTPRSSDQTLSSLCN